jgi:coenzyme F420-reducing hydrogenase alpha subunit
MASVKAIEDAMSIDVPERAEMLRRLLLLAQTIQSHALHIFFLALPDFYPVDDKSVLGLAKVKEEFAKSGVFLRKIAQNIVEELAVRAIHPEIIPGGVARDLSDEKATKFLEDLKKALKIVDDMRSEIKEVFRGEETIQTAYLSLASDGIVDFYSGQLVAIDEKGNEIARFSGSEYEKYIEEKVEAFSYTKFPYLNGRLYRVGPLARLNVGKLDTDIAYEEQKEIFGNIRHETLLSNYARFVELVYSIEKAIEIIENIKPGKIRAEVEIKGGEGVGVVEAPRGTLIHHYVLNDKGLLEKANLIVPTTQNNPAINADLNEVYQKYGAEVLETFVRAYDPCLSCSTH